MEFMLSKNGSFYVLSIYVVCSYLCVHYSSIIIIVINLIIQLWVVIKSPPIPVLVTSSFFISLKYLVTNIVHSICK